MSEQENIKIAQSFFQDWNDHALGRNDHMLADNYEAHAPGSPGPQTREQARAYNQGFLDAFPDSRFEITLTIAHGDYVVTHWMVSGTHTGPLRTPSGGAIPPTGKKATVTGSTTAEIKNGKAVWTDG
jgi:predicted ester cyclase